MIGITLSSEQIRNAPPDVRRWIEQQVMTSIGQQVVPDSSKPHGEHLVACSERDVAAILSQIEGVLPAVNVFFEFGRQGAVIGQPNVEAFRLLDIAHHTRLQNVAQVVACLDIINQALGRISGDATAKFCALDREGHCFIALQTQQNILKLWRTVIASQQLVGDQGSAAPETDNMQGGQPRQPAADGNETAA